MRSIVLAVLTIAVAAIAPGVAAAKTLQVDDDRVQCRSAPYTSIQPAVDAAAAGDEIRVCQGTYAEQVVLPRNKNNLSLRSVANLQATLRQPPGGVPVGGSPSSTVVVRGENTLVRGFRIVGPTSFDTPDGCEDHTHRSAVGVPEGSATIDSNRITSANIPCPPGRESGGAGVHTGDVDGLFLTDPTLPSDAVVKVDRNAIEGGSGVIGEGASRLTVQRNTMTGTAIGFGLAETFEFAPTFTATLRSNDITGYFRGVSTFQGGRLLVVGNRLSGNATGMALFDAIGGELRANSIEDGGAGILIGEPDFLPNRFLVRDNLLRNHSGDGIHVMSPDNQLFDNRVLGSGGLDCRDDTTGTKTAGTANTWARNVGATDSPNVCRAP